VRLSIATRDIARFVPGDKDRPAKVDVEVLGLLGPEGAMPLHITRWIMARLSERWFASGGDSAASDTTFLDLCNLLQHRMMALYWRAWADARAEVQLEQGRSGRAQALQAVLAGTGLPGMASTNADRVLKLRHATSLGAQVHGVERLTDLLADLIQTPVRLAEFVGYWMEIPPPLQSRLGTAHVQLGASAVVGARSFQRQSRAELQIGPLSFNQYRKVLDDKSLCARIRHAIRFTVGSEIDFDLRLVLARAEVPDPRLGQCQLGRSIWISPPRQRNESDLRLVRYSADTERDVA
jgi:type VI secretion system protein ImpH